MKIKHFLTAFLALYQLAGYAQTRKQDTVFRSYNLKEVRVQQLRNTKVKSDTLSNTMKLQLPLLEIPQNIISISSGLLQSQGALELRDVARNVSGVYFGYNSTPFDNSATVQMRGFMGYTTLNGMSRRFNYGAAIDDEALIENVEIVKGPAGFLNSFGEPGGSVNIVTKTPKYKLLNVSQSLGSFNFFRTTADLGAAVKDKGLSYRLNLAYQHRNSYLDDLRTDKYTLAPVIQYNFSPNTFVLAEYNLIRGETKNGTAIVKVRNEADKLSGPIAVNYSAGVGLPRSYAQNQTARFYGVHKFNKSWQLTSQSSFLWTPYRSWNMTSAGSLVNFRDGDTTRRRSALSMGAGKTFSTQLFANGRVRTGTLSHQLVFGADYINSKDSLSLNNGTEQFVYLRSKPDNQVDATAVARTVRASRLDRNTFLKSVYAYDNIDLLEKLRLTLGARYTWYKSDQQSINAKGVVKPNTYHQKALSPRVALTYLMDKATTFYLLYDETFIPQTGQKAIVNGGNEVVGSEAVNPEYGTNMELGVKRDFFNSRLYTGLSAFRTVKRNGIITDLEHEGFVKELGQVVSKGIELDLIGHVTDALSLVANYTFVDAVVTKNSDESLIGKQLPQTPQQIINTWIQYGFPLKNKAVLKLSVGQSTLIKRSTSEKDLFIPDFTKFDAGLNYTHNRLSIQLIADNLTNRRYMASGDIISSYPYEGRNYYYIDGDPFNMRAIVGFKF
ncbi:MAG: TonB-dependent receptor [Sphingobacterium sp.]|jgi:iron complex outermembrane receptor protein|nr:TonB-dependent receptor [Sphingobacterium sp.]